MADISVQPKDATNLSLNDEEEEEEDVLTFGTDDESDGEPDTATTLAKSAEASRAADEADIIAEKPGEEEQMEERAVAPVKQTAPAPSPSPLKLDSPELIKRRQERFGLSAAPAKGTEDHGRKPFNVDSDKVGPSRNQRPTHTGGRHGGRNGGIQQMQRSQRALAHGQSQWPRFNPAGAPAPVTLQPHPPPYPPPSQPMASAHVEMMGNAFQNLKDTSFAKQKSEFTGDIMKGGKHNNFSKGQLQPNAVPFKSNLKSGLPLPAGRPVDGPEISGMHSILPAPLIGAPPVTNVAPASTWVRDASKATPSTKQARHTSTTVMASSPWLNPSTVEKPVAQASTWINPKLKQGGAKDKPEIENVPKPRQATVDTSVADQMKEKDAMIERLQAQLREAQVLKRKNTERDSNVAAEEVATKRHAGAHAAAVEDAPTHLDTAARAATYDGDFDDSKAAYAKRQSIHDRVKFCSRRKDTDFDEQPRMGERNGSPREDKRRVEIDPKREPVPKHRDQDARMIDKRGQHRHATSEPRFSERQARRMARFGRA